MKGKLAKSLFVPVLLIVILIGIIIFFNIIPNSIYHFTITVILLISFYIFLELFGFLKENSMFSISDQNIVILVAFYGIQYVIIAIVISNIAIFIKEHFYLNDTSLFRTFYVCLYNIGSAIIGWSVISYAFKWIKLDLSASTLNWSIVTYLFKLYKIDLSQFLSLGVVELFVIGYITYSIGIVTLIASLEQGIFDNKFKHTSKYLFYTASLCLVSILLFKQAGILGMLLLYCVFIPIKKNTETYTIMHEQQEELFTDALTKVNNYKFLNEFLDNKIIKKRPFYLFMTDLNKFKLINDTYGHDAGNKVLINYADTLVKKLPNGSTVFRFGGDEFIIVTDGTQTTVDSIKFFLEDTLNFHIMFNKKRINYGISYGYGMFDGSQIKQDVIDAADKSMYEYKKKNYIV